MALLTPRGRLVAIVAGLIAVLAFAWGFHVNAAAPGPYFTGKLRLVPLTQVCQPVRVLPTGKHALCPVLHNGHQYYALGQTYSLHEDNGRTLIAPAGMRTDLASIPQLVWNVLPPDGSWDWAAGIHDDCYMTKGTFRWIWSTKPGAAQRAFAGLQTGPPLTRAECDDALRQGMVATQVPSWKRVVIYEAVRIGGGKGWGN